MAATLLLFFFFLVEMYLEKPAVVTDEQVDNVPGGTPSGAIYSAERGQAVADDTIFRNSRFFGHYDAKVVRNNF